MLRSVPGAWIFTTWWHLINAVGYTKGVCLEMNPNRVDPKGIVRSLEWLKGSPGMLPADS